MKTFYSKTLCPIMAMIFCFLFFSIKSQAQFTKEYGNNLDESFNKVIRSGNNYYVLGRSQTTANTANKASVTRLNAAGQHMWTVSLNIASEWADGVLTPAGELMLVGYTLPADATAKSLMGLITAAGAFTWVRSYDVPGRDFFTRIVRTPVAQNFIYYVLGAQNDPGNPSPTWDDVVLLNVNAAGAINWKRKFESAADDEWVRDMEVLPNGELVLVGNTGGSNGIILKVDGNGILVNAATPENLAFSYYDIIRNNGGGFYAVGAVIGNFTPYLIRYDANFNPLWHVSISGLNAISQVWENPATARTYVTGTGVFNGKSRAVLIRFVENGPPSIEWVRFLDNGELSYTGGSYWYMSPNQIAFSDGRLPAAGGFGGVCAFMHLNDMELTSCMTKNVTLTIQGRTHIYNSPDITSTFFDIPRGTDILSSSLNWKDQNACRVPCSAVFTFQNISPCGNVQFTNQSTGAAPLIYSWNFSDLGSGANNTSTAQNPLHQFSFCGNFKVCLKITASDGCMDSICKTVTYFDNVKPIITCPKDTMLPCNSSVNPSNTGFATATDNCMLSTAIGITFADMLSGQLPCNATFMRTWEVTDGCANTASCKQIIKVLDNKPPQVICPPNLNVQCNTNTNPPVTGVATATDDCTASVNIIITHSDKISGLLPCDGLITRTWEAIDDCKNKSICIQIIKIKDSIPSVIKCPKDLNLQCPADTSTGSTGIATANDNCTPTASIILTHTDVLNGSLPCNATITRTWVAKDACGNTSRCTQLIKIKDTIAPIISCPRNPTVNTNPGVCFFTGNYPSATATDSCDQSPTITCSLLTPTSSILITPSTQYPKGVNTITCFARDDCGNQSQNCTFTLTVVDNEPPKITCPLSLTVLGTWDSLGRCKAVVKNIAPIAKDNCPMFNVNYILSGATIGQGINDASGTSFMSGATTVTYIVSDMGGNKDTCSFTITVRCENQWTCPCKNGTVGGPNLVVNGNFNAGNFAFTNDFSHFIPNGPTSIGSYSVLNNIQVPIANNQWACNDHTTGTGSFLVVDGASSAGNVAWRQTIPGSDSGSFNLCLYVNNIVIPSKDYDDPVIGVFINNIQVIPNTTLLENPDAWVPLNASFNAKLPATIEIRTMLNQSIGNDFAIDDISFIQCATFPADSCVCGSFSNLSARLNIGQQNLNIECGKTYLLDCPKVFQFGGDFNCKGDDCDSITKVEWNINGPIGGGGTVLANSGFSLPLNAASFSSPGLYTLTLVGYCDGKPCPPCIIYFESKGCDTTWPCPCPNGIVGTNLIMNGNFSGGNSLFTSDFNYVAPGGPTNVGDYSVVNNSDVPVANAQWACNDHTSGTGLFLICDGTASSGAVGWRQTINGSGSGTFNLCFYANNLVVPSKNFMDPDLGVFINGVQIIPTVTLPETPDVWVPVTATWTGTLPAIIEIKTLSFQVVGNDFALDDIAFTQCTSMHTDTCCKDSIKFANAVANFQLNDSAGGCTLFFNGKGLDACMQVTYIWGDGDTTGPVSNATPVSHTYAGTGTHNVCYLIEEVDPSGKVCWSYLRCDKRYLTCDSCCKNYDLFCQSVMNAVTVTVDSTICKATLNIGKLPLCDYIESINWGDTSQVSYGPFTDNSMVMHTYAQSGTIIISYLAIEINPLTGLICFEKLFKDTITLNCGPCKNNLVPNPSFEVYDTCPSGFAPPFTASIWTLPSTGSSDYYNSCASVGSGVSTPSNSFGTQVPHTGAGYAGFILRPTNNYREYLEVPLINPLIAGCHYQVSFYVSLADQARWAIDKFGAFLSIGAVGPIPLAPAFTWLTPQVINPLGTFITDKIGWTLVSGTYLATGGEDHLVIGNFYDNVGTTPVTGLSGFYPGSYYYIDDVSVCSGCPSQSIDSTCCADSTDFAALINQGFTITQNNCKVTVTSPQFDSCYYFGTPPVLDGAIVSQVVTDPSGSWMYTFNQSGFHQICVTVFDGCNVKKMCTRFEVKCDTCKCGKFDNIFLRPTQGAASIPVSCDGEAPTVPCPPIGKPFNISGQFKCDGGQCPSTPMNWILLDPMGQIVDSGVLISNPNWSLNLTSIHFGKKGTYCLQLFGHCGSQLCKCVIKFTFKEPCPCDDCTCGEFTEMLIRSGQGQSQPIFCDTSLSTERYIFNSCEDCNEVCPGVCFLVAGGNLCRCYLEHIRTSSGVKLPCPPNGQDVVITGQVVCQGKDCPKTTLMDWVLSDPNGFVIASMQNVTATPNFTIHISPLLLTQSNDYTLQLISHCGDKECICEIKFQIETPCPDKCECDKFSLLSSISRGPIVDRHCGDTIILPKGLSLFFSAAFNCKGVCPPYPPNVSWTLSGPIGFKPINGIAKATPNLNLTIDESTFTLPGSYVLTMIGHCGNKECKCTITFINGVGQSTPLKTHPKLHEVQVFPNPNFGSFFVQLSAPAKAGMVIRVVSLTGQPLFERKAEIGATIQNIIVTILPQGLYFVQVFSDGKPVTLKFVKQ